MKHAFAMVLVLGGCSDLELDFKSDATSIVVTAEEGRTTRISICPASTGLLTCDDTMTFTVEIAGEHKTATPSLFGGFQAHFAIDATGIPVNVTRDLDGATATVVVPPAFAVTGPTGTASRKDGVVVRWAAPNPSTKVRWNLDAGCDSVGLSRSSHELTADDGELKLRGDDFEDIPANETCESSVTIVREHRADLGPPFAIGSVITGAQERTTSEFNLTP